MPDVCHLRARSIEGALRASPNVTRLLRDEITISSACSAHIELGRVGPS